MLVALVAVEARPADTTLFNPYERPKNGPPLGNIFSKVEPEWLWSKLRDPKNHPSARMPDFRFSEDEVLDIMAFLKSLNVPPASSVGWPAWADKGFDEMNDDEFDEALDLADRGRAAWGNARCTICHSVNGPGGNLIGGFVDLRVGGIDLQIAGPKLKREWLYRWIKEPKDYFAETLMPRYRFSDDDIKALVEYILRDDAFLPVAEEASEAPDSWETLDDPQRVTRGKRTVEMSRCVVCHDIKGITEVLSLPERQPPPPAGTFEFLVYDLRCLSCHSVEGRGGTYAPDLTGEGSRLQRSWIEQFVASTDMIRPLSQQMPKFNLTAKEARTIAAYVSTNLLDPRIPTAIPGGSVTSLEVQRGRQVFREKGCFSCHSVSEGAEGVVGPSLMSVGDRLKAGYIWYHLKNPYAVNPYSAEPDFGLSDEEARALAAYLSTRKQ
ncbi:MAG: c-type cytochrome [Acidobacteriota bacterium]